VSWVERIVSLKSAQATNWLMRWTHPKSFQSIIFSTKRTSRS